MELTSNKLPSVNLTDLSVNQFEEQLNDLLDAYSGVDRYYASISYLNAALEKYGTFGTIVYVIIGIKTNSVKELIDDEMRLAALDLYLIRKGILFGNFDKSFDVSSIKDRICLAKHLLKWTKLCEKDVMVERIIILLVTFNIDDINIILQVFMIMFFKCPGAGKLSLNYLPKFDPIVYELFLKELDKFLVDNELIREFLQVNQISNTKCNARTIKQFFNKAITNLNYQNVVYSWIPNFIEMSDWDTLNFLIKNRFFPSKNKEPMSHDAWIELSQLLVLSSPPIMERLLKALRKINAREAIVWKESFDSRSEQFEESNEQSANNKGMRRSNSQNAAYYVGNFDVNSDVTMVDSEEKFIRMINELKNENVIGLDTEWMPLFHYKKIHISIIQIASPKHCYVLDLLHFTQSPANIQSFQPLWQEFAESVLQSDYNVKIGYNLIQDLTNLANTITVKSIKLMNTLDFFKYSDDLVTYFACLNLRNIPSTGDHQKLFGILSNICKRCKSEKRTQHGLSLLIYIFFGKDLNKGEQMSNWNRRPLRRAQKHYAVLDAVCLVDIYSLLEQICFYLLDFSNVEAFLETLKYQDE